MDHDHRQTQTTSDEDQPTTRRKMKPTSGKPRGRPYGSKNKSKPPIIITRESPNTLITHFLEIPPNHDVIQTLTDFTSTRQRALCILTASGTVTNLSLRQPPPPHQPPSVNTNPSSSVLNFAGKFEIVSMSGAFLPPPAPPPASGMSVFVSGGVQGGMVLGGKVVGKLMTAGVVVVVVSSFAKSPYERLPLPPVEDEEDEVGDGEDEKMLKIEPLSTKDMGMNQESEQQLMMMLNASSAVTTANVSIGSLLQGFGHNAHNEMQGEEFWGGGRPPF